MLLLVPLLEDGRGRILDEDHLAGLDGPARQAESALDRRIVDFDGRREAGEARVGIESAFASLYRILRSRGCYLNGCLEEREEFGIRY